MNRRYIKSIGMLLGLLSFAAVPFTLSKYITQRQQLAGGFTIMAEGKNAQTAGATTPLPQGYVRINSVSQDILSPADNIGSLTDGGLVSLQNGGTDGGTSKRWTNYHSKNRPAVLFLTLPQTTQLSQLDLYMYTDTNCVLPSYVKVEASPDKTNWTTVLGQTSVKAAASGTQQYVNKAGMALTTRLTAADTFDTFGDAAIQPIYYMSYPLNAAGTGGATGSGANPGAALYQYVRVTLGPASGGKAIGLTEIRLKGQAVPTLALENKSDSIAVSGALPLRRAQDTYLELQPREGLGFDVLLPQLKLALEDSAGAVVSGKSLTLDAAAQQSGGTQSAVLVADDALGSWSSAADSPQLAINASRSRARLYLPGAWVPETAAKLTLEGAAVKNALQLALQLEHMSAELIQTAGDTELSLTESGAVSGLYPGYPCTLRLTPEQGYHMPASLVFSYNGRSFTLSLDTSNGEGSLSLSNSRGERFELSYTQDDDGALILHIPAAGMEASARWSWQAQAEAYPARATDVSALQHIRLDDAHLDDAHLDDVHRGAAQAPVPGEDYLVQLVAESGYALPERLSLQLYGGAYERDGRSGRGYVLQSGQDFWVDTGFASGWLRYDAQAGTLMVDGGLILPESGIRLQASALPLPRMVTLSMELEGMSFLPDDSTPLERAADGQLSAEVSAGFYASFVLSEDYLPPESVSLFIDGQPYTIVLGTDNGRFYFDSLEGGRYVLSISEQLLPYGTRNLGLQLNAESRGKATPSEAQMATPSDTQMATPSDTQMAAGPGIQTEMPSDTQSVAGSDTQTATPSNTQLVAGSGAQSATPSDTLPEADSDIQST